MTELMLFILVGAIAVAAAVMMLLSENAVHSALFLILTMGCLAFLFLLLNAPFLAMIQITVYAGAIMVLFLFVIMLLGAEKLQPGEPGTGKRKYAWFSPLALTLALSLLIAAGMAIVQSRVDLIEAPAADPQVRVINATLDIASLTILANGQPLATDLAFGEASEFIAVPAGEAILTLAADGEVVRTLPLDANTTQTLIAFGPGDVPVIAPVFTDLAQLQNERTARVSVFNAYAAAPSVSLWELGSDFSQEDNFVIVPPLGFGQLSNTFAQREGTLTWTFVPEERTDLRLYTLLDYEVERGENALIVLTEERLFDGTTRPNALPVETQARSSFGSPRAIGELLFIDYMLPFQLLAVLLLAAMVGAILLVHRETDKSDRKVTGRRKVARSLTNVIAAQVGHDVTQTDTPPAGAPTSAATDPAGD